jgi:tetratricopeptide (TPR) repeat protein
MKRPGVKRQTIVRIARQTAWGAGLALLLWPAAASAKGAGSASANFLKIGIGGRGVAMGEAQTAAVNDVMAVYWNPAGLGPLRQNEVGFMRNNFFQGIHQDVLYYAHPTERAGTFGVGLSSLRVGDIAGYDETGNETDDLSASDTLASASWGKTMDRGPLSGTSAGASLKFLQKKLDAESAGAVMADLGLIHEVREGWLHRLRAGLSFRHIGAGIKFMDEKSDLPFQTRLGLAYPVFGDNMTLAADAVLPKDNQAHVNLGAEYRLWSIVAFRLGYKGQNDLDSGLTYGVGFGNERMKLDYAFVPFGALGDTHRVSVGLRFGRTYRRLQVQTHIQQAYEKAEARYVQGYLVDAYIQARQIVDVAPWHRPSRSLMRKVEKEFQDLENTARQELLKAQVDDHFSRGERYFEADELVPAKKEFEAILRLQPSHVGAIAYLKRIQDRFSNLVQAFYQDGMNAFAQGNYSLAREQFTRTLAVDPNHAEAREQLVRTERLLEQEEKREKIKETRQAVESLYSEALTAFERKEYALALDKFQQILNVDPENGEAKRYRAICRDVLARKAFDDGNRAAQDGDWSKAYSLYRQALQHKPGWTEAEEALQKVQANLGEKRKDESQVLYKQGLEAFLAGNDEKALEFGQQALEKDPENKEAQRLVERITQKRQNSEE